MVKKKVNKKIVVSEEILAITYRINEASDSLRDAAKAVQGIDNSPDHLIKRLDSLSVQLSNLAASATKNLLKVGAKIVRAEAAVVRKAIRREKLLARQKQIAKQISEMG